MTSKILITGAIGQLGKAVVKKLGNNYKVFPSDLRTKNAYGELIKLDITNTQEIKDVMSKYSPDIIINLAAMTDVDGCEKNPLRAKAVNTEAVKNLLKYFNGKFIQISSDYVFDGTCGPYLENDNTNPINVYGETKLESEEILINGSNDWCTIRTNVLFDYDKDTKASFLTWVINCLSKNQTIHVVNDQYNNPTWTSDFANIIDLVVSRDLSGTYHYGGADYLNRYEFAIMISEVFNLDSQLILPIDTKSLNQSAKRPLKGGLVTGKIEDTLNIKCNKLRDILFEIKSRMRT